MTTSIRMNGSKNKADTRSIHLLVRLFSVPKSSHAISPFIFIRLGQLLHPSCGFRTHLYSLQSGNCIALANVLQKASGPLLFLGRLAAAGEMSLLWTLSVPPLGSVILGRGGSCKLRLAWDPPPPT